MRAGSRGDGNYIAPRTYAGSLVALKVISVRYSGDPESRERFRRGARGRQLRHPNVAGFFVLAKPMLTDVSMRWN
jgi:hypothetical protein